MSGAPRDVVLLGSTGSIGTQAVDVVRRNPDRFRVVALAAGGGRPELLAEQAAELGVRVVAVDDRRRRGAAARRARPTGAEVLAGPDAAAEVAGRPADVVLNGITGAVGLAPTLAALRAGSTLALANKESLIMGGALVTAAAAPGPDRAGRLGALRARPVPARRRATREVRRLVLTASGGPFRGAPGRRPRRRHARAGARPPHLARWGRWSRRTPPPW